MEGEAHKSLYARRRASGIGNLLSRKDREGALFGFHSLLNVRPLARIFSSHIPSSLLVKIRLPMCRRGSASLAPRRPRFPL